MGANRKLEQQIAVFGEGGSGKTVLLSSFFGATEDPEHGKDRYFEISADSIGQGQALRQNYLDMEKNAKVPLPTMLKNHSYSFTITPKRSEWAKRREKNPVEALRLTWHDYPGEWFEQDLSSQTEARRRVETFRSLLGSDVALLLVDGQQLLDYKGDEQRYLKSLFGKFRGGLASLREEILENNKPFVDFPRIWVVALSKADLHPNLDVQEFKDLIIHKAAHELDALRQEIAKFISTKKALSVGEDFLLLSSAKFEPEAIRVKERIGIDMLLPLAAILPFERLVRWEERLQIPRKVAESFFDGAAPAIAMILLSRFRMPGPLGLLQKAVAGLFAKGVMDEAMDLVKHKLVEANQAAKDRQDYLTATLTGFKMDLERGEEEGVLLRSKR